MHSKFSQSQKYTFLIYDFTSSMILMTKTADEQLSFYWFLPSPSRRSSSCVLSGWFWRSRRPPLPAGAEPCGWAAAGWRRSPARAEGSGSFCPLLWKSQRTPGLTDSRLKPAGPHVGLRSGVTSSSLEREMSQGRGFSACCNTGVEASWHNCWVLSNQKVEPSAVNHLPWKVTMNRPIRSDVG